MKGVAKVAKEFKKNQLVRVMYRKSPYVGRYCSCGTYDFDDETTVTCDSSYARRNHHCVRFIRHHIEVHDRNIYPISGLN